MGERAKKLRQRRKERRQRAGKGNRLHTLPKTQDGTHERAERPTEQRAQVGHWVKADGRFQDLAADMIGWLLISRQITPEQEQAARTWQAVRTAYVAELQLRGYRSCLNNEQPGHDDSDGDPEVLAQYRRLELEVGRAGTQELVWTADEQKKPRVLGVLKAALDVIGGT